MAISIIKYKLIAGYTGKNEEKIREGVNSLAGRKIKSEISNGNFYVYATKEEIDKITKSGLLYDTLYK